jgi:hypothetical protein
LAETHTSKNDKGQVISVIETTVFRKNNKPFDATKRQAIYACLFL